MIALQQDLMRFVQRIANNRPILISGDFNAEPIEPVYNTVINYTPLRLSSAYADLLASISSSSQNGDECDTKNGDNKNGSDKNVSGGGGGGDGNAQSDSGNGDGNGEVVENDEKNRVDHLINHEPPYTTWKIREDGEVCHTIDYVFYSQDKFKVIYLFASLLFLRLKELLKLFLIYFSFAFRLAIA